MAQTKKAGWGLIAAGLVFAIGALIPVVRGLELKGPLLVVGLFFIAAGVATARKAPPPDGSGGTQPHLDRGSGGA